MSSVTKTNTGLTSYLGFLNALSGSPEILKSEMLDNKELVTNLKSLFSGVERVSGSDTFLEDMFLNSNKYEAVIASESSLIRINTELERKIKKHYICYIQLMEWLLMIHLLHMLIENKIRLINS